MKVNCLFSPKDEFKKIIEVHIENHGIKYIIKSDFKGIKIESNVEFMKIIPVSENSIII